MGIGARTQSLTSQSVLLMAGRGVGFVMSLATPIVLVRLFVQADFGVYKQFFLIAATVIGLADVGFAASLYYFIPKDRERAGNYLLQTASTTVLVGALVAGTLWVAREPFAAWLNSPAMVQLMPLLFAYVVFEVLGTLLEFLVVLEKQARLAAIVFAGSDTFRVVSIVGAAVVTTDLRWVAAAAVLYAFVRFTALVVWSFWQYRARFQRDMLVVNFGGQLRYALPFGAAGLLQYAVYNLHAFYAAATVTPALYAVYAVGCQQIAPISIFFRSVFEVTLVRMTEHAKEERLEAMRQLWYNLIAKQAILLVPLFVVLWVLAEAFIEGVFTAEYLGAVPIFRIYLLLVPLTMLNDHAVLRALARTGFILLANSGALLANVLAVPILATQIGLRGAVTGFIVGVVTMKAFGLWKVAELLRVPVFRVIPWKAFTKPLVGSVVAASIMYPVLSTLDVAIVRFFVCGALFWAVYFGVAWVGNVFGPDEKRLIHQIWQRVGPATNR